MSDTSRFSYCVGVVLMVCLVGCSELTQPPAYDPQGAADTVNDHDPHDHVSQQPSGRAGCMQSTGVDADGDGYVDQVPCDAETQAAANRWAAGHSGGQANEIAAP